jgi:hypothetical protein
MLLYQLLPFLCLHIVNHANLCRFLIFVARFTKGRHKTSPRLSYFTYVKARTHLLFCAERSYCLRIVPSPPRARLYNQMTEAMQAAARKFGLTLQGVLNRTFVDLDELRLLIDHELVSTPCIELSECHQLAWCLGRTCAVRPGSLGTPRRGVDSAKLQFLAWRDITITRIPNKPGMFMADIRFRNLKTNTVDLERASRLSHPNKVIECRVLPP